MNIWKRLFGSRTKATPSRESLENLRDSTGETDVERCSCMDVVQLIGGRVAKFKHPKGMVVVLQEGCRVQIYFFDGVARTTWGYNNGQFTTDHVGEVFQLGPPSVMILTINTESLLLSVLQREFKQCDMKVGPLWQLDPTAWDYEMMKVLHADDVGIRISFDAIP